MVRKEADEYVLRTNYGPDYQAQRARISSAAAERAITSFEAGQGRPATLEEIEEIYGDIAKFEAMREAAGGSNAS